MPHFFFSGNADIPLLRDSPGSKAGFKACILNSKFNDCAVPRVLKHHLTSAEADHYIRHRQQMIQATISRNER